MVTEHGDYTENYFGGPSPWPCAPSARKMGPT